jgi:hypothetical protein
LSFAITTAPLAHSHEVITAKSTEAKALTAEQKSQAEGLTIQLGQSIKKYRSASTAGQATLLENLQSLVDERRVLMQSLIKNHPATALRVALPERLHKYLPDQLKTVIEHSDEIEGELEVLHVDSEDPTQSHYEYYIKTSSEKRISLHFATQPQELFSGTKVRANGLLLSWPEDDTQEQEAAGMMALGGEQNNLELLEAGGTSIASTATSTSIAPNTFGEQRVAVLLVNFVSVPQEPWTIEQARNAAFGDASEFFRENSYGQTWLNGDVFGWITLAVDPSGCPSTDIMIEANKAAGAQGIKLADYTRIVYAFPNIGCSWSGQASVGGNPSYAWIDGTLLDNGVLIHELGHGFGLFHSNALECGADVVGGSCLSAEYGDALDKMGRTAAGHFNAYQKERLGWLNYRISPSIVTADSTGVYQLETLSTQTQGSKAIRILRDTDPFTGQRRWYYLEFRQASGSDSFLSGSRYGASVLNGLLFHLGTENTPNSSFLLDITPASQKYDWDDLALAKGGSYTDNTPGVTVSLDSYTTTGAAVSVSLNQPSCARANPQLTLSGAASQWVSPGTPVTYSVTVTNKDSSACSNTTFDLAAQIPSGWSASFDLASTILAPGGNATVKLTVTSPVDAADGFYDVTAIATNKSNVSYTGSAAASYAVSKSSVNSAPVAVNDQASTAAGTNITIAVLANDSDPDADPLQVTRVSQGAKGTTVINGDGTITYKPGKSFKSGDSFTYDISDGMATATATVAISQQSSSGGGGKGPGRN